MPAVLVLLAPWLAASPIAAGEPLAPPAFFYIQPDPASPVSTGALGVSGDGSTVVGLFADDALGWAGYRFSPSSGFATTFVPSSPPVAATASAATFDGEMVVGGDGIEAHYWAPATGAVPIGVLPGGNERTSAQDVSADGSVIVGWAENGNGTEAFRWTSATGLVGLGDLPGGSFYSCLLYTSPSPRD